MAVSLHDLLQGFDPTGLQQISAAQLLELVTSLSPYTDKGIIIVTTDVLGTPEVPDAATTTKWQRYFWLRISAASIGVYAWNPSRASDVTLLRWESITISGIAAGSIVNSMIADNTITDVKIANLDYSKLLNAPTGSAPTGAAGGDLAGTYPNPVVAPLAVSNAKLAADAVTNSKVLDNTLTLAKLTVAALTAGQIARINPGATAWQAYTKLILELAEPAGGQSLNFIRVNAGGTGFEYVTQAQSGGNLLQSLMKASAGGASTATVIPADNTIPQIGEGAEYITLAITPTKTTSIIRIRFSAYLSNGTGGVSTLALFQDAIANALSARVVTNAAGMTANIEFCFVSGSLVARTYRIRFGPSAGTTYINDSATGVDYGGVALSYLCIDELVGTLS